MNSFTARSLACLSGFCLLSSVSSFAAQTSAQIEALLSRMTLDEKIGQMTQADLLALKSKSDVQKYFLGSVLSGGGSDPADNSAATWRKTCDELQSWALKTRLQIPLLYGVDAVHGHNNIEGAVVFPHNVGLGATRNPKLIQKAAEITAREIAATGIHWAFAPCVAVSRDIRWGRSYESFGQCPELAGELGAAAVKGFQSRLPGGFHVLACAKHFAGDGGTENGVDQGNTVCDEATLRKIHLAPYLPAIREGSGSIMVSYNSWNGQKMHANRHLLTEVLKQEFCFQGFLISDWAAIDQLPGDYKSQIEASINAGLDMVMIPNGPDKPNNYVEFITFMKQLVAEGKIPQARVDDAVRRILRAKFQTRLFEHPYASPKLMADLGSPAHRKVARECVRQSAVLLKNERFALPLSTRTGTVTVVGKSADDLGVQCGGWTIDWQGKTGRVTPGGTTIWEGLKRTLAPSVNLTYSPDASSLNGAGTVVVVIGEQPYAEMKGDRKDLSVAAEDAALVAKAKASGAKVVTIVLSGRPLILGSMLDQSDALLAAWLPGTEGQGVVDVLTGAYKPTGKLPRVWPRSNAQLGQVDVSDPQFPCCFGLTY